MHPEEAVMQLDIEKSNFLVFTNAKTNRVNVVYHRNDGNYGLIQPKI
jgi:putative sigma-54 modulation protein